MILIFLAVTVHGILRGILELTRRMHGESQVVTVRYMLQL